MQLWSGVLDVVILLVGALLLGVLFERARQSALVGYLIAGSILGPRALNLVRHEAAIVSLAELGVALLLFSIGLEFSWRRIRLLGRVALLGGTLQIVLTAAAVTFVGVLVGLGIQMSLALGIIIAPSSTACVLRMLLDRAEIDSVHGRASLGILLLQDAALIPLVLMLTALSASEANLSSASSGVAAVPLAAVLLLTYYLVANFVLPHVFTAAAVVRNRELPILLAVVTFLASAWAAHAVGLSAALGAFVGGVLLAESPYATWVRADVSALRTLFVTLFFASIGMLGDLLWIQERWLLMLTTVPALVVGKALIVWLAGWMARLPARHAIATGLCLAQTGEFSFVLAQVSLDGGLIGDEAFRWILAATVLTLLATPYLVGSAPRTSAWTADRLITGGDTVLATHDDASGAVPLKDHLIIVGFGPAGQGVFSALQSAGMEPAIIDLNPRTVREAGARGVFGTTGDATHPVVLERVHVSAARAVVITIPDHSAAMDIAGQVRALSPAARIFARARYHIHAAELDAACDRILDEEQEVGRRLGLEVLRDLGFAAEGSSGG